jgi:murein DD-endopeptidase MepM/ murein hydrolase activator NlpD
LFGRPFEFALLTLLTSISFPIYASQPTTHLLTVTSELQQGSLVVGNTCRGCRVEYAGRSLKLTEDGLFVFGLGRNFKDSFRLRLFPPNGHKTDYYFPVKQREYDIQFIKGVPQKTVTPDPADQTRILEDSFLVQNARKGLSDRLDFVSGFQVPLDGPITGVYGSQRVYNGTPKSPHYGVDYAAETGAIVAAPASGIVTLADLDLFYSGGTLILDHGFGLTSSFLHLSGISVKTGQFVERGEPIAKVGSTGRSTGPHLDWRMNWYNIRIDPQLVLESLPVSFD